MKKLFAAAAMALALGGLAASPVQAAAPLEAYGRLPSMESVSISPDGTMIAFIVTADTGNDRYIVVQPLGGEPIQTASIGFRKVRYIKWAGNDHVIIVTTTTDVVPGVFYAGEMRQGASLNVRNGKMTRLPERSAESIVNVLMGQVQPGMIGGKPSVLTALFVADGKSIHTANDRLDLYSIDLDSGIARRQQMGDTSTRGYLARNDGTPLAKVSLRQRETVSQWTLSLRKGSAWQDVYQFNGPVDTPDLFGITRDGTKLVVDSYDEEEGWRLTYLDIATGKLGDHIGSGGSVEVLTDNDAVVLGYQSQDSFVEYDFTEPALKAAWPMVKSVFKGKQVTLSSWTPDFGKLVVYVDAGSESGAFYLVDLTAKKVNPLGRAYPKLAAADVGEVRAVKYKAADGLEISGYLTLPPGKSNAKGLPLIVLPHGGPQVRDGAGFDWWSQSLASRGYAVLQPNYRGSAGFGQAFVGAAYGEWGRKMQTDLSDGVSYLAAQGTIDPKRVCIVGASYGGYAALAGVTLQKDVYRCAVSVAGISDVSDFLQWRVNQGGSKSLTVRYWTRFLDIEAYNDPKLATISPAKLAAKASAPILLIHGQDDTTVPYSQSTGMTKALQAAGKPVEFVALRGEDHFLSSADTRLEMLTSAVTFLEKNNPPN
ncbi:peptidase S9 [Caulobacter sp. Root487D2Y]|uniref:alpha/beta hydrolase family protein n=1 Tax=Caulobacter sp. Root487D2Y TaxID=1736547 RepID=UPI0007002C67|nr:S9 family peptidase [Caulobacter sp. Root487D2Y]KQY31135.1 peptidase S9 [Caulobacter sp. Root487D2Y]